MMLSLEKWREDYTPKSEEDSLPGLTALLEMSRAAPKAVFRDDF
jgi:hypothetical protein